MKLVIEVDWGNGLGVMLPGELTTADAAIIPSVGDILLKDEVTPHVVGSKMFRFSDTAVVVTLIVELQMA
ncbi:hypothetical protein [Edaphobacter modestus]|uniref:Uncharacterized protein n=1 Tax=Edaphobacter modestus TaxID=388466 RepID=A0A4Q7YPF7_9BACT|nr:hypothetical protein [Edaphobacter modestus]RZU39310.1 hypothetical protein BDD14_0679 [Edaphobacter modestus]